MLRSPLPRPNLPIPPSFFASAVRSWPVCEFADPVDFSGPGPGATGKTGPSFRGMRDADLTT